MAYIEPTIVDIRMRYPAFTDVPDATLTYWLADAHRFVDQSWPISGDYGPALIAVACHNMIGHKIAGISDSDVSALLASGVTDFQSGGREGFRVSFSPDAVKQAISSEYDATAPGQEYTRLLKRNFSGPRVTSAGRVSRSMFMPGVLWGNR